MSRGKNSFQCIRSWRLPRRTNLTSRDGGALIFRHSIFVVRHGGDYAAQHFILGISLGFAGNHSSDKRRARAIAPGNAG
jgi:hypothetical protein